MSHIVLSLLTKFVGYCIIMEKISEEVPYGRGIAAGRKSARRKG